MALDLEHSMQCGKLQGSQLAGLVLECCRALAPLELSDEYEFVALESAIKEADELVVEADAAAGKIEWRDSAIGSVGRVVSGLAKAVALSRRRQKLVIEVTERILGLPDIDIGIRWPDGGKDEFYNTVTWGKVADVERMLDEFCDD